MSVDTRLKLVLAPSIACVKVKLGTLVLFEFNLYCSVGIPSIISFLIGFPIVPFVGKALFNTLTNCSYQFGFAVSFQMIVWFSKFILLESTKDSVVDTLETFRIPFAAILRFGL